MADWTSPRVPAACRVMRMLASDQESDTPDGSHQLIIEVAKSIVSGIPVQLIETRTGMITNKL
jgi:hypothetical protein